MWFKRRGAPIPVHVFGKDGCHLCEEADGLLLRLARRYPMTVTRTDIRTDPDLFRRYDIRIPVIVIAGEEIDAPVREADVVAALRRAARRPAGDGRPSKSR